MFDKSCQSCGNAGSYILCDDCRLEGGKAGWQPSELYTAYLQEVEKNAKLRAALESLYGYHKKSGGTHYIMMAIREVLDGE